MADLTGSAGADTLRSEGADEWDTLTGLDGNDTPRGGAGNDSLAGGGGWDRFDPGAGRNTVVGGESDDSPMLAALHPDLDFEAALRAHIVLF